MKTVILIIFALFMCVLQGNAQQKGEGNVFVKIDPPSVYQEQVALAKGSTALFNITYVEEVDSLIFFPQNVITAVAKAFNIWEHLINSFQPINVKVIWRALDSASTLAHAKPTSYRKNFSGAPKYDVYYPIALAEKLANVNFNGDTADIEIVINAKNHAELYYGTDGNTPADKFDLVSIMLHEICHGLGFAGSFHHENGKGYRGVWNDTIYYPNTWNSYDVLLQKDSLTGQNNLVYSFDNATTALGNAIIGDKVFLFGPNSHRLHSGLPKIYAPTMWKGGSSIGHLDLSRFPVGSSNSLMKPSSYPAEAIHSPGEVGLAILEDIGWSVNRVITVTSPEKDIVLATASSYDIVWTDNKTGTVDIYLLKDNGAGTYISHVLLHSNFSSIDSINRYTWTVQTNLPLNTKYKIQIGTYGMSNPFVISNIPQVAKVQFSKPAGTYDNVISGITLSTTTPAPVTIYFTTDGSNPLTSSTRLTGTSVPTINTTTTVKAAAVKSGYSNSVITSATYILAAPEPIITTSSGDIPSPLKGSVILPPTAQEIWYYFTTNGTEPSDPIGGNGYFSPGSFNFFHNALGIVRYKVRAKKNGIYSPVVERTYNIIPSTIIKQVDSAGNPFGNWSRWENNQWQVYSPDTSFPRVTATTNWVLKAQQEYKSGTFEKFRSWNYPNTIVYKNHSIIPVNNGTSLIEGRFTHAKNATLQSQLIESGSLGSMVEIKDPWFPDYNESPYGTRNRGDSAIFKSVSYSSNNVGTSTSFKGVFLNQSYSGTNPIFYSVNAPSSQTINGIPSYFYNWSGSNVTFQNANAQQTGVVFNAAGATATANYKAQLATNVSTNFTNSGQRKIVRTSDGTLHLFYESIGKVWYEQSTNGGASWCQPFSVDDIVGKLSSVCTYGSDIVLAYQKNIDGNAVIQIEKFTPYPGVIQQNSVNNQITTSAAYSSEITPAIISNDNDLLLVSWQENNYVKYQFFWITGSAITLPTQSPSGGTIGTVNTFTPAVAVTPGTGWPKVFHTAFEKRTATSSNIVYRTISVLSSSFKVTISTPTGLSSGSGYTWNYRPSIIAASGDIARVNWIGQRLNPSDPDIQENVSLLKISNGSSFWAYGNTLVTSTQINKSNNGFLLAYSNNGTIYHKNHNNYNSQPNPTISGISGGTVQVAEGLSNNSFYVAALNTTQQPYRFNVGSITLSKEQSHNIAIGRSGVIVQDDAEFYFVLGDISVDGEPVDFVSFHDSLKFPTVSDLNSVLTTQPFHLTNNSQFFYSVQYGTTDSINAVALFSDAKSASFTVELIDDQTNQVLGSYDQIAFNANNPTQYNNLAYQVNTEGIGNRTVRLRLVASYNGLDPAFGVTNRQATESVMGKRQEKQIKNISFKGSAAITEYALEQNYPNPFNPSTTINYALPKSGFVTLKVYDVLGREVATLVNDHKETGRYSVQFDGSKLSSGTYIYKLTADKFSDVKKFVLVK